MTLGGDILENSDQWIQWPFPLTFHNWKHRGTPLSVSSVCNNACIVFTYKYQTNSLLNTPVSHFSLFVHLHFSSPTSFFTHLLFSYPYKIVNIYSFSSLLFLESSNACLAAAGNPTPSPALFPVSNPSRFSHLSLSHCVPALPALSLSLSLAARVGELIQRTSN